jgi:hypothetical protein
MTIRPHKDRVLLELIPDDRSQGDIVFADQVKQRYIRKAKVLAIANDCKIPFIPGQTVWAIWNCGVPLDAGDEGINGATGECRLLKSEDVVAIGTLAEAEKDFDRPPTRGRRGE